MSDQFKEGDVVELKSGGPKMTVDSINRKSEVKCCFFKGDEPEWITLPSHTLKRFEDKL